MAAKDLVRASCGGTRFLPNLHRYRYGTPERPIGRVTLHFYIGADAPGCPESRSSYAPGPAGGRAFVACRPSPGRARSCVAPPPRARRWSSSRRCSLPVLLLIVGIIQFGLLFGANVTLTNAAREGRGPGRSTSTTTTTPRPGTTPSAAATWPMRRCSRSGFLSTSSPHFAVTPVGRRVPHAEWRRADERRPDDLLLRPRQHAGRRLPRQHRHRHQLRAGHARGLPGARELTYQTDVIVPFIGGPVGTDGNGRFAQNATATMVVN